MADAIVQAVSARNPEALVGLNRENQRLYSQQVPHAKRKRVWATAAGIGGGVLGALNTVQYTMGALGIFSWPTFVNTATNDAHGMIVAIVVSLACTVAAFIGVLLTYSDET